MRGGWAEGAFNPASGPPSAQRYSRYYVDCCPCHPMALKCTRLRPAKRRALPRSSTAGRWRWWRSRRDVSCAARCIASPDRRTASHVSKPPCPTQPMRWRALTVGRRPSATTTKPDCRSRSTLLVPPRRPCSRRPVQLWTRRPAVRRPRRWPQAQLRSIGSRKHAGTAGGGSSWRRWRLKPSGSCSPS